MRRIILNRQLKQENIEALTDAFNIRQEFNLRISSFYMKKIKIKDYYLPRKKGSFEEKEYFYGLFFKYYFEPHHYLEGSNAEVKELFNNVILSTKNNEWTNPYLLCTDIRIINLCIIRVFNVLNLTEKINKPYYPAAKSSFKLYSFLREMFVILTMNENYFLDMLDKLEEIGIPEKLINNTLINKVKYMYNTLLPANKWFIANYRIWSLYMYLEKPFGNTKILTNIITSIKHLTNYIKEKFPSYLSKQIYNVKYKRTFRAPKKYSFVNSDIVWLSDCYNSLYEDLMEHKNNIQKMLEIIDSKIKRNESFIMMEKSGTPVFGTTLFFDQFGKITIGEY